MSYTSLGELKSAVKRTDATDDTWLQILIDSASIAIDRFCNRDEGFFVAQSEATDRYYRGRGASWQEIDECIEVEQVAVKDSVSDATYTLWSAPTTNMAGDGDWLAFSGDPDDPDFNSLPYDALMVDINGDYSVFTGWQGVSDVYFRGGDLYPSRRSLRSSNLARVPTVRVRAKWGWSEEVPEGIRAACVMQASRWFKRLEGNMATALANAEFGTLEVYRTLDPDVGFILNQGRYIRPPTGRR